MTTYLLFFLAFSFIGICTQGQKIPNNKKQFIKVEKIELELISLTEHKPNDRQYTLTFHSKSDTAKKFKYQLDRQKQKC